VRELEAQGGLPRAHDDHYELISGRTVKRRATGFISEPPIEH
jgi:hypothetical protein